MTVGSPLVGTLVAMVVVVSGGIVLSAVLLVGPRRLRCTWRAWRWRLLDRLPSLLMLGVVITATRLLQRVGNELTWLVGWNATSLIYAVEGGLVATLQAMAWPPLTAYLASAYVYGFSFLLIFPFVAYTTIDDVRPFRETVAAFSGNYLVGLVAYTAIIAYGPRNHIPDQVSSLLYTEWPASHLLTGTVTLNTNVFPSLHTSFVVTVALLAWRTRAAFPGWTAVAAIGAASIVVATMYLGIHWATDVVAGILVAIGCTAVGIRDPLAAADRRIRTVAGDVVAWAAAGSERYVGDDEDD